MTRKLKTLGMMMLAVFAMSSVIASAAQAQGKFTWGNMTQELKAEQDAASPLQKFTTTSAAVEEKGALSLLCLLYVLFCIRSFLAARRARLA